MFRARCAGHGADTHVSASCVEAFVSTPAAVLMRRPCPCDTRGTLRTGTPRSDS